MKSLMTAAFCSVPTNHPRSSVASSSTCSTILTTQRCRLPPSLILVPPSSSFLSSLEQQRSTSAAIRMPWKMSNTKNNNELQEVNDDDDDDNQNQSESTTPSQLAADIQGMEEEEEEEEDDDDDETLFLRSNKLTHLKSLEHILEELEDDEFYRMEQQYDDGLDYNDDDDDDHDDDHENEDNNEEEDELLLWDEDSLTELLASVPFDDEENVDSSSSSSKNNNNNNNMNKNNNNNNQERIWRAETTLEQALLQGVVPVSAGVGNECLPGDYGFDPLQLATKDYFLQTQRLLLRLIPPARDDDDNDEMNNDDQKKKQSQAQAPRPRALILRDYREAEIRHGRLAMLAAVFWPLQEMLDRLLLDEDLFGPLIYGPVTLPYFPLVMTAIMMLLGYLDIYSQAIKERDYIGEAFLPGDCFWDPLRMLEGAPDRMKRNMQERELFNGRVAMLAVAAYTWEEGITHLPLIEIPGNELLLEPAYQVPFIQQWLDEQFALTTMATSASESVSTAVGSEVAESVVSLLN